MGADQCAIICGDWAIIKLIVNEFNALCDLWALRQYTRNQKQANLTQSTRFIHTCSGA